MNSHTPWLTVVGLGEDGIDGLSDSARRIVESAEVLIGGRRHLEMIPDNGGERQTWKVPFTDSIDEITKYHGSRVVVIATGDPLHYGVAVTLAKYFSIEEMIVLPNTGAMSLACARLGWPVSEVECVSLHGRPLETIKSVLAPDQKLIIFSHDRKTPNDVAAELCASGYGSSDIVVFQHMGGGKEARYQATAETWTSAEIADLNTIAIHCRGGARAKRFCGAPGLRDRAFKNDGQITKREVRSITLSSLAPSPGALLWDIGAGCGSISIEWMLAARGAHAFAIEKNIERIALISTNAIALGVPKLEPIHGIAPDILRSLASPQAIFIGGGLSQKGVVEQCWNRLSPGGRLVVNAVSLQSEALMVAWREKLGGDMARINISRAKDVTGHSLWRPLTPVTQWAVIKG